MAEETDEGTDGRGRHNHECARQMEIRSPGEDGAGSNAEEKKDSPAYKKGCFRDHCAVFLSPDARSGVPAALGLPCRPNAQADLRGPLQRRNDGVIQGSFSILFRWIAAKAL